MDRVGAAGKGKDCEAVERSNPSSPGEVQLDAFLKNQGLYRKRIAKDGSCLFRAVAEQVFHTQSEHLEVRGACVSYLRRNQEQFEAFIEGSFDEYLKQLEKPQEWVGQVEISALSLMYKRDFIIYQEPNRPPARVTENGFPDTISLCFSNGNHYDSVYPRKFVDAAALCQSILYEMLYQDILKIDVEPMISALDVNGKTNEHVHSSEDSDSGTEMELHRGKAADESDMSGFKSQSCNKVRKKQRKKSENAAQSPFPGEVLRAFNPNVYRNIEYEVWQESKQAQQERDYSIAAGMQYVVGDKCKVCLDNGKYYNAHIQAISPDNGPVDVYIEELGEKHSALLQDLRPLTQGSQRATWSRAQGKRAKKPLNVNSEADFRGVKNSSSFASKSNRYYSSLPPRLHQAMAARQQNSALQNPEQQPKVPSAEFLGREEDFPQLSKKYDRRLEANQTKVASKDVSPSVKVDPGPNETEVSTNVHPRVEKSLPAVDDPLEKTPSHTRTEQVDPILQVDLQTQSSSSSATSENPPVVPVHLPSPPAGNSSQMAIPSVTPSSVVTTGPAVSQAPMSSVLIKPLCAPFPGPNLPLMSAPQLPSAYDLLYPGFALNERGEYPTSAPMHSYDKSGADLPEDKSILRFFYNLGVKAYSLPWWPPFSYLYPLTQAYFKNCAMYPGCHAPIFPANPQFQAMSGHVQNENVGGPVQTSNPQFQAMAGRVQNDNVGGPVQTSNPQFQAMAGHVQNENVGGPVQTSNPQFQAMAGRVQNDNVGAPLQTANPREINALPQLDVGDDSNHSLSSQATTRQLPHKNKSVPVSANPGLPPQNFNPPFPSNFPHFLSDGAQLSGWAAPPPSSLITQNAYMHAFGFHPMYMTAPGQVYPIQINGGTSACIVDQKIDAPDQSVQISDNAASPKLEEAERPPLEFSQAGECRLSQVQSALFKDPRLVTETVGSVIDLCPSGSEQQSAPGPQEECVNQNSVLGERKPEKASLISSAGLYSEHTRNIQPQDCASHSEINSQFSEAKSNIDSASQSTEKSKVDPVQQSVADTSTNQKSRNNYKTPDTACNKHAQFHKRARGMNYNIKDSPSEKNAFRSTPYIHRKGEREMNRKDKSGKQWSRDTSFLHDSNIDRTSQAVSKGESKPPTKDRIVERSEAHIGFGGHENLRIKVENQRPYMSENAPCEETYLVNRSDGDAKQFQNQVVVEDTSGIMHEEKRNSYRKQRYKDSGKSNTYPRK